MTVIHTARLALRELREEDAPFALRLLNEPSFIANIADRGVRTEAGARAYLRDGPLASYARHGFGLWRVEQASDGAAIGICGLIRRDALADVDIGYALLPEYCARGYAREAAQAVLVHARERIGLRRVVAVVNPDNERSIRLLLDLGFVYEQPVQLAPGSAPLSLYAWTAN